MRKFSKIVFFLSITFCCCSGFCTDKPLVLIPYRADKEGKGMRFDHTVFRKLGAETKAVLCEEDLDKYKQYMRKQCEEKGVEDFSEQLISSSNIPDAILVSNISEYGGLLFLPGSCGDTSTHRQELDKLVICDSLKRGRPILAVCAGSWSLCVNYKRFINPDIVLESVLREAHHHTANRMVTISKKEEIIYNTQIHAVQLEKETLLYGICKREQFDVNSVHSKVLHEECFDDIHLTVSSKSMANSNCTNQDGTAKKCRQGEVLYSDGGVVEAFECKYGSPVIGTQWHPEAYAENANDPNCKLLKFMLNAASNYSNKVNILKDLKSRKRGK